MSLLCNGFGEAFGILTSGVSFEEVEPIFRGSTERDRQLSVQKESLFRLATDPKPAVW